MYVYLCVSVHFTSSVSFHLDGHLGYFHVLAAVHNAAVNVGGADTYLGS